MADVPSNPPNIPGVPLGAEPGKKTTGKVAPKKETVRITLPPKPSAAPTIKLPTLPPGGPTGAPSAAPAPAIRTAAAPAAPKPATPAAGRASAAVSAAPRTAAPRPAPTTAAAPTIGTLDNILAMVAMVAALFAVGTAVYFSFLFNIGS